MALLLSISLPHSPPPRLAGPDSFAENFERLDFSQREAAAAETFPRHAPPPRDAIQVYREPGTASAVTDIVDSSPAARGRGALPESLRGVRRCADSHRRGPTTPINAEVGDGIHSAVSGRCGPVFNESPSGRGGSPTFHELPSQWRASRSETALTSARSRAGAHANGLGQATRSTCVVNSTQGDGRGTGRDVCGGGFHGPGDGSGVSAAWIRWL